MGLPYRGWCWGRTRARTIDPPSHFIEGGAGVDKMPLEAMIGPCIVRRFEARFEITADDLQAANIPAGTTRLLLATSSAELWDVPGFHTNYTGLSLSGAEWCLAHGIRLVGIDYMSIEQVELADSLANT